MTLTERVVIGMLALFTLVGMAVVFGFLGSDKCQMSHRSAKDSTGRATIPNHMVCP